MPITLEALKRRATVAKVIVHSLDPCLYQCTALVDGQEVLVVDDQAKPLRAFNVLDAQAYFDGITVELMVLRQQSAYDEMVGQPLRDGSNTLEVPLGRPFTDDGS